MKTFNQFLSEAKWVTPDKQPAKNLKAGETVYVKHPDNNHTMLTGRYQRTEYSKYGKAKPGHPHGHLVVLNKELPGTATKLYWAGHDEVYRNLEHGWPMAKPVHEEIKGWKHAHTDMMKARSAANASSGSVVLHKLNADGKESGMHDARKTFESEDAAHAHVENIKKLNPGKKFKYNKYVNGNLVGTIDEQFINELIVPAIMPSNRYSSSHHSPIPSSKKPMSIADKVEAQGPSIGETPEEHKARVAKLRKPIGT